MGTRRQFRNALPVANGMFLERDAAFWRELAPAAADNYYVRSLLGEHVFGQAAGTLTREHLEAAKVCHGGRAPHRTALPPAAALRGACVCAMTPSCMHARASASVAWLPLPSGGPSSCG